VLVEAPEEFYQTLERLLDAVWSDIQSVLLLVGI
jgi:hypothetical protein